MLAATYRVTIERHEVGDIPALTFQCEDAGQGACPFVFALHGLTSRKERHLDLCLRLSEAGFRVCAFDIRGHGERRDDDTAILYGDRHAPGFASAFIGTVVSAIEDIIRLTDYFGLEKYAIVGHSMGGYIALQAALNDPRVAAVVNIAGSIDTTRYSTRSTEDDNSPGLSDLAAKADVAGRASELKPRPILLLHGEVDETVPVDGARKLYSALQTAYGREQEQVKLILYPTFGHRDLPGEMVQEAVDWLIQYYKPR